MFAMDQPVLELAFLFLVYKIFRSFGRCYGWFIAFHKSLVVND